jgi:hypothetical protein
VRSLLELQAHPRVFCRLLSHHAGHLAREGRCLIQGLPMEYAITAAFLLAVVAGSFAAVILGGYGIAQLIVSAL